MTPEQQTQVIYGLIVWQLLRPVLATLGSRMLQRSDNTADKMPVVERDLQQMNTTLSEIKSSIKDLTQKSATADLAARDLQHVTRRVDFLERVIPELLRVLPATNASTNALKSAVKDE